MAEFYNSARHMKIKMTARHVCASHKALKNLQKNNVLCNKVCQCYSVTKRDVQALENEVKSMSEVINILREELKYDCTSKGDKKTHSTYAEKLKANLTQCEKCTQLESQFQKALNELS